MAALSPRASTVGLVIALVGVSAYAFLRPEPTAASKPSANAMPDPTIAAPPGQAGPLANDNQALPPGHPAIGASSAGGQAPGAAMQIPPNDDPPAITWTAPTTWSTVPNPSPMRLATYRVPRAAGVTDDADLAITRAGGSTDANIQRWLGQFDSRGKDTRTEKTVHGIKTTIVEVSGTYLSGGMMGAATPKTNWTLLAAIVEAPGTPYFFKLTGPSASVQAARAAFLSMLDGITPTT